MGWKLFAGLNVVLALAVTVDFLFGSYEPSFRSLSSYVMSCLAGGMVCLYAFDARIIPVAARTIIAISISIFAVVETVLGLWSAYLSFDYQPFYVTVLVFAIPLILSVFSLIAAWRYSRGRTASTARA